MTLEIERQVQKLEALKRNDPSSAAYYQQQIDALITTEYAQAASQPMGAAPTMAGAASKILTVGALPAEGETVSLGGVTYKFRAVLGEGVKATAVLTSTNTNPADGDTVKIDVETYRFKTTPLKPMILRSVPVQMKL